MDSCWRVDGVAREPSAIWVEVRRSRCFSLLLSRQWRFCCRICVKQHIPEKQLFLLLAGGHLVKRQSLWFNQYFMLKCAGTQSKGTGFLGRY